MTAGGASAAAAFDFCAAFRTNTRHKNLPLLLELIKTRQNCALQIELQYTQKVSKSQSLGRLFSCSTIYYSKIGIGMTCKLVVGGDAFLAPADKPDFMKIQCEFETSFGSMWASPPTHESWYVTKNSPRSTRSRENYGAGDRARTGTSLTSRDFKSRASANSATPANQLLYTTTNTARRQAKTFPASLFDSVRHG